VQNIHFQSRNPMNLLVFESNTGDLGRSLVGVTRRRAVIRADQIRSDQIKITQTGVATAANNDVVVQGDAERRWMRGSVPPTVRSAIFS